MGARRKRSSETPPAADSNDGGAEELSFEAAVERLESLVDRLEQGDLPLEDALRVFEEGVGLMRQCAERLETAERRIEVLVREGDEWTRRAFGETDAAEDDA